MIARQPSSAREIGQILEVKCAAVPFSLQNKPQMFLQICTGQ
jgi:hypothetical protein